MNLALFLLILIMLAIIAYLKLSFKDPYTGPRDSIYFGYYGDMAYQLEETKDHINLAWVAAWDRHPQSWVDCMFERITQASIAGKKSVIMMTNDTYVNHKLNSNALQELDELLFKLKDTDCLKDIAAIYPVDEPDYNGIPADEMAKGNAAIRSILAKYPALKNTALAVFYTGHEKYPGIEHYDWVGFDEYGAGEKALGSKYKRMVSKLRSDQRTMIIPGGCDKWRQDPRPFVDFALANPRVVAVVPFIWIDQADPSNPDIGHGIRSNGLKEIYKEAGLTLIK